jgi:hypothetical protein
MVVLNQKETINFRSFMDNSYKEKKTTWHLPMMTVTFFSPTALFHPPPVVVQGYAIILIVGFVLVSATFLEKYLAINGLTTYAETIIEFIKGVMPWALMAALIMFVLNNPLM